MPTVIDALVVELGLDTKKFTQGQREVLADMRKLEEGLGGKKWSEGWEKIFGGMKELQQGAVKHVRAAKSETDNLTQAFTLLQGRLLSIAALFTGGLGIAEFTQHITRLTAETGRLSQNFLGISAQKLAAWEGAGGTVGARPGEIGAGLRSIVGQQKEFLATGRSPLLSMMGQLGLPYSGTESPEQIATTLSKWMQGQKDKAYASHLLQSRGGLSEGMINLLALGPDELQKRLKDFQQFAPSEDQIKKFTDLQAAFAKLTSVAEALGRAVVAANADKLKAILDDITAFLEKINSAKPIAPTPENLKAFTHGAHEQAGTAGGLINGIGNAARGAWNYTRRLFGGGSGDATGDNTPPAAPGTSTDSRGEGQSSYLRQMRQPYMDQINADPSLRMRVAGMLATEGSPQASMESMLNRLALINQDRQSRGVAPMTVDQMLNSGFYGPINRGELPGAISTLQRDPRRLAQINGAIDRAGGGSHVIGGRTDQGLPSDPNGMWPGGRMTHAGNVFNDWGGGPGGHAGAQRFRENVDVALAREDSTKSTSATASLAPSLPSLGLTGLGASMASRQPTPSFNEQWDAIKAGKMGKLGGASAALANGPTTNTNTNTSSTHIGEMHVTVPPGADPDAYANGIKQKLMQYNNVQNANTGQF